MRFCGLLPLFTSFIALNPLHACNKEYLKKLLEEDNSEKLTEKEVNPKRSQEKIKPVVLLGVSLSSPSRSSSGDDGAKEG